MGCCFSKKCTKTPAAAGEALQRPSEARDPLPPEEEKVKEVLSETPNTKPRCKPKQINDAVAPVEREEKVKTSNAKLKARDLGRAVVLASDEKSETVSESSAATSVTGPARSPAKPARKRAVSGELGRARRDRAPAVPGAGRRVGRGSPSPPPPRRDPGERSGRRSPSPAAKRPQEQRGATAVAPCTQRKPPVPARPCGRASPRRTHQEAPPPLSPTPQPPPRAQDSDVTGGEGVVAGDGDGEGQESLDNPLVAMECFIFL